MIAAQPTLSPAWDHLRTDESRMVEQELGKAYADVAAYRYNAASLRIRVIDERFRGLGMLERDDLVSPELDKLPVETQGDIINLLLMYPGEEEDSLRISSFNAEFEHGESGL